MRKKTRRRKDASTVFNDRIWYSVVYYHYMTRERNSVLAVSRCQVLPSDLNPLALFNKHLRVNSALLDADKDQA